MIQCPKCNFTQPDDQYCAQCGVNMQTYIPTAPTLQKRLITSPGFYLFLMSAVVISTSYLIYDRILKPMSAQDTELSGAYDYASVESLDVNRPRLDEAPKNRSASKSNLQNIRPQPTESTQALTQSTALPSARFNIALVLAPPDSSIFQDADLRDAQSGIVLGAISERRQVSDGEIPPRIIHSELISASEELPFTKSIQLTGRENETFGPLGISIQVTINDTNADSANLRASVTTSLLDADSQEPIQDTQEFSISNLEIGQSSFSFGILPHRAASEIEAELLPSELQQVFDSEDFVERATELFLVIEYAK